MGRGYPCVDSYPQHQRNEQSYVMVIHQCVLIFLRLLTYSTDKFHLNNNELE